MDRETSPKPPMCRGGCGFYGSAATEGLCSQCYKKHLKRKQEFLARNSTSKTVSPSLSSNKSSSSCYSNSDSVTAEFDVCNASGHSSSKLSINSNANVLDNSEPEENPPSTSTAVPAPVQNEENPDRSEAEPKEKKNRCAQCGKKVGLTGFTCRCGGLFCPIHRYSDRHNCTFDYRELGAEEIRRNNPTVTAEKIRKI